MVYYLGIDGQGMYEMKRFKTILCFYLLACLVVCTGFTNEEGNLIANPEFTKDDQGAYSVWNTDGAFSVSSKVDEEMGEVLSIETQETEMDFYQSVNVMPETIYCSRRMINTAYWHNLP